MATSSKTTTGSRKTLHGQSREIVYSVYNYFQHNGLNVGDSYKLTAEATRISKSTVQRIVLGTLMEEEASTSAVRPTFMTPSESSIDNVLVCRVCLESDVKLFSLLQSSISESFARFSETPVSATDGIPQYMCNSCLAIFCKFLRFKSKCQQAYNLLKNVCADNQITKELIEYEVKPKLSMQLRRTPTEIIYLPPENNQIPVSIKEENNIKLENSDLIQDAQNDFQYENAQGNFYIHQEPMNVVYNNEDFVGYEEKNLTEKALLDFIETNDNNVILEEKADASEENHSDEGKTTVESHEPLPTPNKKKKVNLKKRSRPCNEKSKEDFVAFAEKYNVDVIFLTKEQQLEQGKNLKFDIDAHNNYQFTCDVCNRGFKSQGAFKKHATVHDPSSGNHVCEICQIRFHTRKRMLIHARRHRMQFVCKICNRISRCSFTARVHHIYHEGQKFECKYCNKKFNALSTKLNHERDIHKPVTCEICQHILTGNIALTTHRKTVHTDITYTETSTTERGTNENVLNLPEDKREDKIDTFSSESTKVGSYMCEICAKSYNTAVLLRYHQKAHTGEKPFPCTVCPKKFRTHWQQKDHMNMHTGERPYKCKQCTDAFKSYSHLGKHKRRIHTSERPYKCNLCDKTFVIPYELKAHVKHTHLHEPRPPRPNRNKLNAK